MRLLAAGLLTAYLLGIGAGPTLAQSSPYEPEAPSWRVEVPEAGLALSLPRHWEVRVRMDEPSLGEHLEDPDRSWWLVLDAKSPYEFKEPRHGGCDVWLFRTEYPDTDAATLDDIWSDPYTYWNSPMYEATHTETEVALPAGPATRFDFDDEFPWGWEYHADYRMVAPHGVVWLMCQSTGVRPDDSIAETLQFLSEEK